MEDQGEWESEKLWLAVTHAINNDDQIAATDAKTILEESQRERAKERKLNNQEWVPKYFVQVRLRGSFNSVGSIDRIKIQRPYWFQDIITGNWVYRHADVRPWDPRNDVMQYEYDYIIRTKTRHKTPVMRAGSIVSVDPQSQVNQKNFKSKMFCFWF